MDLCLSQQGLPDKVMDQRDDLGSEPAAAARAGFRRTVCGLRDWRCAPVPIEGQRGRAGKPRLTPYRAPDWIVGLL